MLLEVDIQSWTPTDIHPFDKQNISFENCSHCKYQRMAFTIGATQIKLGAMMHVDWAEVICLLSVKFRLPIITPLIIIPNDRNPALKFGIPFPKQNCNRHASTTVSKSVSLCARIGSASSHLCVPWSGSLKKATSNLDENIHQSIRIVECRHA